MQIFVHQEAPSLQLSIVTRNPSGVDDEDMTGAEVFASPDLSPVFPFEETIDVTNTNNLFFLPIFAGPDYTLGMREGTLPSCGGVSGFDIIEVRKHLLNTPSFSEAWQYFAADVNNTGTISTFDMIEMRKKILGVRQFDLDWKFFPLDAQEMSDIDVSGLSNQLPNVSETITYTQVQQSISGIDFSAIRIGDLNRSDCDFVNQPPSSSDAKRDLYIKKGITSFNQPGIKVKVEIPDFVNQEVFSLGLEFDPSVNINVTGIEEGNFTGLDSTAYSIHPNGKGIDIVWYNLNVNGVTATTSGGGGFGSGNPNTGHFFITATGTQPVPNWNGLVNLNYDKVANVIFTKVPQGQKSEAYFEINTGGFFQGGNNSSYQSLDNDNLNVLASPMPFSKELRLEIDSPASSPASLIIMDMTGRILLNRKVDLQKGYNDIWLRELVDFPVGVLSYRLSTSELSTSGKIIKH